jgi:hypothetical protein
MKFKFLIVFLSLIICAQNIFAKDVGTTMFQILQMPTNAYDAALAETSISGESSSLSNPSLVPFAPRLITLSHVIFLEEMSYSIGDINFPFNERSAINFSFCYFDSGKIDKTIDSGSGYYNSGTFNATDKVFNLSYGQIFGKSFSAGASIKFIEQKIDDISYSAFALNLSGLYFITNTIFCNFGINNLGSEVKGYSLPTNIYCGLTATINETTVGVIQIDDYYNEDSYEVKVALEKKVDIVAMRFGYVIPTKDYNGTNNSFATNLTLGLGLKISFLNIDYAWLPKGDLGNIHMFTVGAKF